VGLRLVNHACLWYR